MGQGDTTNSRSLFHWWDNELAYLSPSHDPHVHCALGMESLGESTLVHVINSWELWQDVHRLKYMQLKLYLMEVNSRSTLDPL